MSQIVKRSMLLRVPRRRCVDCGADTPSPGAERCHKHANDAKKIRLVALSKKTKSNRP